MSDPRYHTHRWRRMAQRQLAMHPLCNTCMQVFARVTVASVADHIEPHHGDEFKFWNNPLQSLCASCHSSIKQQLEKSGFIRGHRLDGMPIDPQHPWNTGGT